MGYIKAQRFNICQGELLFCYPKGDQGEIFCNCKIFTITTTTGKEFNGCCPVIVFSPMGIIVYEFNLIKKKIGLF